MNEIFFEDVIKNYLYKNDFYEWMSLTRYNFNKLSNEKKIKCFNYFNNNKNKIIELKKKILDK